MSDYHLLGLGDFTSVVTEVQVRLWGSEVSIQCLYDPATCQPYSLLFTDCREIRWNVHDSGAIRDSEANLIGFLLGQEDHQQPAVITTDIFEIFILYGRFEIKRVADWRKGVAVMSGLIKSPR